MKTIIAGSRRGVTIKHVTEAMSACGWTPTEVVSGGAWGADIFGEDWADAHHIPVVRFDAAWTDLEAQPCVVRKRPDGTKYNVMAGFNRNKDMAGYADALVAVWDGRSNGTRHMINAAEEAGLKVYIHWI